MDSSATILPSDIIVYKHELWDICQKCSMKASILQEQAVIVLHRKPIKSIFRKPSPDSTLELKERDFAFLIKTKQLDVLRAEIPEEVVITFPPIFEN